MTAPIDYNKLGAIIGAAIAAALSDGGAASVSAVAVRGGGGRGEVQGVVDSGGQAGGGPVGVKGEGGSRGGGGSDVGGQSDEGSLYEVGNVPTGPRNESGAASEHGFMKTYVRIGAVSDLADRLGRVCGHKIPKSGHGNVALARYTAATVPSAFVNGRARLRALAIIGDSALLTVRTVAVYAAGGGVEAMEEDKQLMTDNVLARAFAASEFAAFVLVGAGVNLGNTKTGATAFEAFAGVLAIHCGLDAVSKYFDHFSVDKFVAQV
jgi:hypothetical protein